MIYAGILAGGKGLRMGSEKPKQFLIVKDKPIIIHTVEKFLLVPQFEKVYVAIHPDWVDYFNKLLDNHLFLQKDKVVVVDGGNDRNDSIYNIVCAIEKLEDNLNDVTLVTHDAVRPFVSMKTIKENIAKAKKYVAIDTVVQAVDTIVVSQDGKTLSHIPKRDELYQGQTPQTFNVGAFKKHYDTLSDEEKSVLTDACKIFVLKGETVGIVEGSYANFKITTAVDLTIANAVLGELND